NSSLMPGSRLHRLLSGVQSAASTRPLITTTAGLILIAVAAWCDLHTVRALNFEFVYLVVCVLVGWTAGATGALICTFASGIFLYFAETSSNGASWSGWIFLANSLVRMLVFALFGWLAARVSSQARDLEHTVQQRSIRLQREVEEHKETSELLL